MYTKITFIFVLLMTLFTEGFSQNTLVKQSPEDFYRNGLELLDKEKYTAARESFRTYIQAEPNGLKTIDAEYYSAYCALILFNADGEALINAFIDKYPYHAKTTLAYFELGSVYFNDKKYDKAITYFEKVDLDNLSNNQKNETNFKLGYAYFSNKNFDKALPLFNQLKTNSSTYIISANYYAGYIELKKSLYNEALVDLKKAESSDDFKTLVPPMITKIYYLQHKLDDVIQYGKEALEIPNVQSSADINLLIADAWFYKKQYAKAIEHFEQFLKENKAPSKEIAYRIGYSNFKTKNFDQAIKNLKSVAGNTDTLSQAASFYLGLSYLSADSKEYALAAFDQSRKASFTQSITEESLFLYGKLTFELQRFKEAIQSLKEFVSTYDGSSTRFQEANELLSEAFLKTNNYNEAISYIESLKIRSPRINKAYQVVTYYKATEYFNVGNYGDAKNLFDKSMQQNFDQEIYLASNFWKAEVYSINKEYPEAIKAYATVFDRAKDPNNEYYLKARYGIGYAYYNTQQYEKAFLQFKEYVTTQKTVNTSTYYTDALVRLADLYYEKRSYSDALVYYDLAIKNYTTDVDYAYYQKGIVQVFEDKLEEAKGSFETVIAKYPSSIYYEGAIYQKAQVDSRSGDLNSAVAGFSKLIGAKLNAHPYEPNSLLKRALIYNSMKKYEEAIVDFNTLLTKYYNLPIHEEALRGAQESYAALDKSDEFNSLMDEFKLKNPESSVLEGVGFESAKNLYFEGKYKKSITLLESYLKRYPNHVNASDAHYFLADAYASLGETEKAIPFYELVVQERRSQYVTKSLQKLADINLKNNNYVSAKNYYQLVAANSKNKKEKNASLLGLMETYFAIKSYDSAAYFAQEVLKGGGVNINAETKANMCLGKIAYSKGEYEVATDYFLNLINYNNEITSAEAQYYIADIQNKQKRFKQSIESLYYLNNNFDSNDYWLGKSFLLISENLIQLNELFQAKSTLESIVENSKNTEVVELAKQKLTELAVKEKEGDKQ